MTSHGKDASLSDLDLSGKADANTAESRRVYIALPTYERHENEVLSSAYNRCTPPGDDRYFVCTVPTKGQSLLAKAFNDQWAACQNDGSFDYWLLNHGDLAPDPTVPYVHVMIEEMLAHNLDVLHCVAALKDDRGLTSTAIGARSNMWTMRRRISQHELELLPETFTIDDCMEKLDWSRSHPLEKLFAAGDPREPCLLANTGMMMVRLTKLVDGEKVRDEWPQCFPGFMIWDRVGFVHADGSGTIAERSNKVPASWGHYRIPPGVRREGSRLNVQCVPEDWYFSIWCAREELRVGATTKVFTDHWGFGRTRCKRGEPLGTEKIDNVYFDCEARH